MKVLISGASGLIGTELVKLLILHGHEVKCLTRDRKNVDKQAVFWDPENKKVDLKPIAWADAIVNLSGENIAGARWSEAQKKRLYDSRIKTTQTLSHALSQLQHPPKCLINASAIGFYGSSSTKHCTERSPQGKGFLAHLCQKWEAATAQAVMKGVRVVNLRFGIVLSPKGGMLGKMLPIFKWGLGGKIGSGKQYMSWIAIDDLTHIILFALTQETLRGPVNVTSPYPVTNAHFTKTLGLILNRPTYFSVPAGIIKMLAGKEMAEEVFLSDLRVEPLSLTQNGYAFLYSDLEVALRHLLIP